MLVGTILPKGTVITFPICKLFGLIPGFATIILFTVVLKFFEILYYVSFALIVLAVLPFIYGKSAFQVEEPTIPSGVIPKFP